MAWPFQQRIAELHETGYEQQPPPPYGTEDHLLPRPLRIVPNELIRWPNQPSNTRAQFNGRTQRGRGRPPLNLELRIKRCLIRLFVLTDIPFEHIANAIASQDGPKRLWVRKFFNDLTGAGKGTNKTLKQLRMKEEGEKSGNIEEHRHSEEVALRTGCRSCSLVRQEHVQDQAAGLPHLGTAMPVNSNIKNAGGHGDLPHVSERNFEIRGEAGPPSNAKSRPEKRPNAAPPRLTEIVDKLDEGKVGQSYHVGRCASVSKPTIASRMSSMYSKCNIRTETSEFINLYANRLLDWQTSTDTDAGWPFPASTSTQNQTEAKLVIMILQAPMEDLKDEKLEDQLRKMFLKETKVSVTCLVNESDSNGTTALHLAVAFGLLKTCGILLTNGANHEAKTTRGTCINHFAKPAEKLAGQDLLLYYRIKHCRRHVKKGRVPPVPKLLKNLQPKKRKRNAQDLALSTETKMPLELSRDQASNRESVPSAPPDSLRFSVDECDDESSYESDDEPLYARDLTTSPSTTVQDIPSTSHARDFAASDNMRHKVLRRNMKRQTYSSDPNLARLSNVSASLATRSTTSLRDFDVPYYADNTDWPSISPNSGNDFDTRKGHDGEPMHMQEFRRPFNLSNSNSTSAAGTNRPFGMMQAPLASQVSRSILPTQSQPPQENAPSVSQPSLIAEESIDSTQGNSWHTASLSRNNGLNIGAGDVPNEPGMLYWHCQHGKPRNYLMSHCPYGCPQLAVDPRYIALYNS